MGSSRHEARVGVGTVFVAQGGTTKRDLSPLLGHDFILTLVYPSALPAVKTLGISYLILAQAR